MAISAAFAQEIDEAQRLRGWIANAYAQIEFVMGDLVLRCRAFPEYSPETAKFSDRASNLVSKLRLMLDRPGPLCSFSSNLISVLERFEKAHETRNLLAHGFCEFLHTPAGDTGLRFQKWHRVPGRDDARLVRTFRISDLRSEQESIVALSQEAMLLFRRIHVNFGWAASVD